MSLKELKVLFPVPKNWKEQVIISVVVSFLTTLAVYYDILP